MCCADGGRSALFRVGNVTTESRMGLFNPFTASGTIIVDGVVASVQSKWFADDLMDALGLTHAVPSLYQARARTGDANALRSPPHASYCPAAVADVGCP